MLVVKIEVWPKGQEKRAQEIGRVEIVNDGTGDEGYGDYDVRLRAAAHALAAVGFKLHAFARARGALALVAEAVRGLEEERKRRVG